MTTWAAILVLGRGNIGHSTLGHNTDKQCIVMMTKEAYTKIVNFIIPLVRVLVLGQGGGGMRGIKVMYNFDGVYQYVSNCL